MVSCWAHYKSAIYLAGGENRESERRERERREGERGRGRGRREREGK